MRSSHIIEYRFIDFIFNIIIGRRAIFVNEDYLTDKVLHLA